MVVEIAPHKNPRSLDGLLCTKCSSLITCRDVVITKENIRRFCRVCCANKEQCLNVECPDGTSGPEIARLEQQRRERSRLPCTRQLQNCNEGQCNQRCVWMACKTCCKKLCAVENRLCAEHSKYQKLEIRELFVELNGRPRIVWKGEAPLASGSFADVYLGQWGLESVAIKSFKLKSDIDNTQKRIESEVEVWSALKSGHVVPLWATARKQDDMLVLVMPLYTNGTLEDFLGKKENRNADGLALRLQLLVDAAQGLNDVHQMGAYHGDITLRNILVGGDGRAALADFGLSRLNQQTGYTTLDGGRGCPTYRALECFWEGELSGEPKARASRDVWAFAIVIVEILTGKKPYNGCLDAIEVRDWLQNNGRPYGNEELALLPEPLRDSGIIWESWNPNPDRRPKALDLRDALWSLAPNYIALPKSPSGVSLMDY